MNKMIPKNVVLIGHMSRYDIYETAKDNKKQIWLYYGNKKEDWVNPKMWELVFNQ